MAVVARDRSGAYTEAVGRGAPAAVQVADRFHLLQNLAEALELAFTAHARAWAATAAMISFAPSRSSTLWASAI